MKTTGLSIPENNDIDTVSETAESSLFCCEDIAGSSNGIKTVIRIAQKVSMTDSSVLITGESGTGKELVARAVHENSPRNKAPMVVINCGAIPSELLESELFGHEKGAFTGAYKSRTGRFELADRGTVFLDEIGDMSPALQVKLLRAIQERKIERVGGTSTIDIDIRIISATNKDLNAAIEAGTFREDLFYRLNVIPIHIPPLRERSSDIPILLEHFQKKLAGRMPGYTAKTFSREVLETMSRYEWPGNIRELENLTERISVLVDSDIITLEDLPEHIKLNASTADTSSVSRIFEKGIGFNDAVDQFQRAMIVHALNQSNWIKARAAEMLKINRTTLVEKIKKMNIEPEPEGPLL